MQKYPDEVTFGRHGKTTFTEINRSEIPGYDAFIERFNSEFEQLNALWQIHLEDGHPNKFPSARLREMALQVFQAMNAPRFKALLGDDEHTQLTDEGYAQWVEIGRRLPDFLENEPEDLIVSPYDRTERSHAGLIEGCPELGRITPRYDRDFAEQRMGMRIHYGDPRIHCVFHPLYAWDFKQKSLMNHEHQGGESFADVVIRARRGLDMISRRYGEIEKTLSINGKPPSKGVFVITHHRWILAARFLIDGWDNATLLMNDTLENRPPTASLTRYVGVDGEGRGGYAEKGWLELKDANVTLS